MTAPTREERAAWRQQATRNVNADGTLVGSDSHHVLALLDLVDDLIDEIREEGERAES